jgi:hypothetical protein
VRANYAYVAAEEAGLWIVNVQNPAAPVHVATVNTPDRARKVVLQGDYAYVADGESGLQVISVVDPVTAHLVGEGFDTIGDAAGIAVAGDYAYVADGDAGLAVINVADPEFPGIVGSLPLPGRTVDVLLRDHYVYLAAEEAGVHLSSIALPDLPGLVASVSLPGFSTGLELGPAGEVLIATRDGGLVVARLEPAHRFYLPVILKKR